MATWGPLVYDFDCDGVWGENDIAIWTNITQYWESLGDQGTGNPYRPANYFSPSWDTRKTTINMFNGGTIFTSPPPSPAGLWNILAGVNSPYDTFTPSTLPYSPSNRAIFNWSYCLNQEPYDYVAPPGPPVVPAGSIAPYFNEDIEADGYSAAFLYNSDFTWWDIGITAGSEGVDGQFLEQGEQRPTDSFFPITKFWAP